MRSQGAALGLHAFGGLSGASLEAVIGGAIAGADALARAELGEGEFGEESVLPPDRAQIPAPQPVLKAQHGRTDNSARRDQQQQPGRQRRVVAELPDSFPDKDAEKKRVEEPGAPLLYRVPWPLPQRRLVDHLSALLRDLAEDHEGAD